MDRVRIGNRLIGSDEAPYYIAEIGANHNGEMTLCRELIDAAIKCGASAVKFQSWSKDSLFSKAEYERNRFMNSDPKDSLEATVEKYQLSPAQLQEIAHYCRQKDIPFLCSCFSPSEVDCLDALDIPAFKIASMDIDNLPLLRYVATKEKPVLLSTGMASLGEIERALATLSSSGTKEVVLLHCVSLYPPPPDAIHLRNISTLNHAFDLPVGFSDHSTGTAVSLASITLGACLVEKHFTLDKTLPGWDHAISTDPIGFKKLVEEGNEVHRALGNRVRTLSPLRKEKRLSFRRRIVTKCRKLKGDTLSLSDLDFKRPGNGISPTEADSVVGRVLACTVEADHELEWSDLC